MIPLLLGLGGLVAKAAAAATLIKTAVCALKAAVPPVSESARPPEKSLYGQKQPTEHKKRYFGQGLVQGATKLFYTMDHLGSIRELVDSSGVVQAVYRYSTYGERAKLSGNLDSDWGWAGLWHHGPSGLDLATYRAYDAANRRWISRDPLGEGVDSNLYRYCGNNPINAVDPAGLDLIYNTRQNSAEGRATLETANDRLYATVPRARQVIDGLIDSGYQVIVRSRAPETGGEGASYTPTTLRNGHWELSSKVIYIDINPKKTRKKCRSGSYPNPLVDEVLSHELEHVYQWIYNTHQTVIDSMNSPPPSNENSPIEQAPLRMNNEVIYEYRRRGL